MIRDIFGNEVPIAVPSPAGTRRADRPQSYQIELIPHVEIERPVETSVPSTPDNIVSDLQRLGVAHVADVLDGTR